MAARCNFLKEGDTYTIEVTELTVTAPDTVITTLEADPKAIKKLIIKNQLVKYFPKGLPALLPNLEELTITECNMEKIVAEDLKGFQNLRILNLSNNCLTHLPDDLFQFVPQLKQACFRGNSIELPLLRPLLNPQRVDLAGNEINIIV